MLYEIARQWRWLFSAAILIGLAAFGLVKGAAVLAQDAALSAATGGQPRQTVGAGASGLEQTQPVSAALSEGAQPAAPTPRPPSGTTYHTVQAGETLGKIAANYGITSAALANANGITDPNLIRVGQKLVIPAH